eukprot:TRINITY_DN45861_c0_g1_i1.p2 TRINITY_DN45861_c0_g1~~TRINITY_DN45861_c0_g1_i1.p2  ORF type:complete len:116 (+),score=1.54 TRINITY_DN45861_c0_g1_i1:119-466(+)
MLDLLYSFTTTLPVYLPLVIGRWVDISLQSAPILYTLISAVHPIFLLSVLNAVHQDSTHTNRPQSKQCRVVSMQSTMTHYSPPKMKISIRTSSWHGRTLVKPNARNEDTSPFKSL